MSLTKLPDYHVMCPEPSSTPTKNDSTEEQENDTSDSASTSSSTSTIASPTAETPKKVSWYEMCIEEEENEKKPDLSDTEENEEITEYGYRNIEENEQISEYYRDYRYMEEDEPMSECEEVAEYDHDDDRPWYEVDCPKRREFMNYMALGAIPRHYGVFPRPPLPPKED